MIDKRIDAIIDGRSVASAQFQIKEPVTPRMPIRFQNLQEAKASPLLHLPKDANYVVWNHGNKMLEEVFASLGPNDILVLPERTEAYLVDSTGGFRAAGVSSIQGRNGLIPVTNTYMGKGARTWFAMARARRGILGLGPGAVIATSNSGFTQEKQIRSKGAVEDGWTSPGRFYWNTAGVKQGELIGAQEKVIEAEHNDAYFGNFTMLGRDFGGISYHAITMKGGVGERVHHKGSWRGHLGIPNGETGAFASNRYPYLFSHLTLDPVVGGVRVGSSPIMINSSPGGRVEEVTANMSRKGMPTLWNCSGKHEFVNCDFKWNEGSGVNLEQCNEGFEFIWTGGTNWPNRGGRGGHPSPDGIFGNGMHISVGLTGAAKITLNDVDIDDGNEPGKVNVQFYSGSTDVMNRTVVKANKNGQPFPVRIYRPA